MAKPLIITKSVSTFDSRAAWAAIVSGLLFILLLGSLHLLEPEFDPTWRFISEYTLGRFGWLMPLAFLALAVSLGSTGVTIFPQIRTILGYIGLGVLGLGVLGLLIASIFRTDPISTALEAMTFSGKMHVLGASLDYTPVAFLLLSFSLARNQAWQPIRSWLFITAVITVVITIAFMLVLPQDGKFGPGVLAGLVGRFLVLSYLGWVATAAFYALKLYNGQE
jgi:hypothetical protein